MEKRQFAAIVKAYRELYLKSPYRLGDDYPVRFSKDSFNVNHYVCNKQNNGGWVLYASCYECRGRYISDLFFFKSESEAYETFLKLKCYPELLKKAMEECENGRYAKKA